MQRRARIAALRIDERAIGIEHARHVIRQAKARRRMHGQGRPRSTSARDLGIDLAGMQTRRPPVADGLEIFRRPGIERAASRESIVRLQYADEAPDSVLASAALFIASVAAAQFGRFGDTSPKPIWRGRVITTEISLLPRRVSFESARRWRQLAHRLPARRHRPVDPGGRTDEDRSPLMPLTSRVI